MPAFFRFADLNGDGTGSKNASVNGSVTPQIFKLAPRGNENGLRITRMLVHIVDVGTFDSGAYGNNIVLTNGITIQKRSSVDDSVLIDLTDGESIKTNTDWGRFCYDIDWVSFGLGNEALNVRWTFEKTGDSIWVSEGEYFSVTINDNLTGLVDHSFMLQGTTL